MDRFNQLKARAKQHGEGLISDDEFLCFAIDLIEQEWNEIKEDGTRDGDDSPFTFALVTSIELGAPK